jgi:hypothetical protein
MQILSLRDLLGGGTPDLTPASAMLAAQQAQLDCTGITHLDPEQLTALFAACPADWERADLERVLVSATVSAPLSQQINDWLARRLGHTTAPSHPAAVPPTAPAAAASTPDAPGKRQGIAIREAIAQALINDLQGPCGGPTEIIDERNVRGRYIVGLLAPKGQSAIPVSYTHLRAHET